ncbi:MAG: family 78 glycoside hydrolase catalytic domain, partial [Clostridia bacterium]|nr:family 78 glycoside hydrolase catalytic domain [Clostridia bacterium]
YYFRKTFLLPAGAEKVSLSISGLGFYRLYLNGRELTKGLLAPYISNPDDIVYFDEYDLKDRIKSGEKNVLGFQLGNGMVNAPGGEIWDFDKASFRSAPKLSFALETGGKRIEADESVKTAPSPLYFDDLRAGARYDARREIPGWNQPDFDSSSWKNSLVCEPPKGEKRVCEAPPVVVTNRLFAKEIRPGSAAEYTPRHDVPVYHAPEDKLDPRTGFLYDFGVNNAGTVRLKIRGKAGQRVILRFGEYLTDGRLDFNNINYYPEGFAQQDVYILKGGEEEVFEPCFTYHGFRYCLVSGIEEEQATKDLLEFLVCTSAPEVRGGFICSDETANTLYEMCDASDRSNFYYFPTDCPHREKNGWTGDASLSSERMLMTMNVRESYTEWLRNIRAAQRADGAVPGIVPTGGWGFEWGSGPDWDQVLAVLPYFSYIYTGDKKILEENADAIMKYLRYAASKRNEEGLVEYGLGDWCPIHGHRKPSLKFTDSVTIMAFADRAAFIFGVLGQDENKAYAEKLYGEMRAAIREKYIDPSTLAADTVCQTSQAMGLYYGLFDDCEKIKAFGVLLDVIHKGGDFLDTGMLGARVIFHVLSDFGQSALAYKMITRSEYPSYGFFIKMGLTSIPECFCRPEKGNYSRNHHAFCDIKNWFISCVAGLRFNPSRRDTASVLIKPAFIPGLDFAEAFYESPSGKIKVRWERKNAKDGGITLALTSPDSVSYKIVLPDGSERDGTGSAVLEYART